MATLQLSLTSNPEEALSTYSFVAKLSAAKPLLSLYPLGTVTVPVPCGVNVIFLLLAVVEMSCPFKVKSSTTALVNPARSVFEAPKATEVEPIVILSFANFVLVTPPFASCVVPIPPSCTLIVIVFAVAAVSIVPSPVNNKVFAVE